MEVNIFGGINPNYSDIRVLYAFMLYRNPHNLGQSLKNVYERKCFWNHLDETKI